MDKELKLISKSQEVFPEVEVSALEVMEQEKQMWRAVELFEQLKLKGEHRKAEKVGKWAEWVFGIELQAN